MLSAADERLQKRQAKVDQVLKQIADMKTNIAQVKRERERVFREKGSPGFLAHLPSFPSPSDGASNHPRSRKNTKIKTNIAKFEENKRIIARRRGKYSQITAN